MHLENKTAVVTGASRGLGKAIACKLAEAGANVACVARSQDALKDTLDAIRKLGRKAEGYAVDVADENSVNQAVEEMIKTFGSIDILVNNAGITRDGLLMRMPLEDWDAVIDTNLKGAFHWTRPVAKLMMKQRSGRIINMSSVNGLMGSAGQTNYAASKAGLIGFTKSVARELATRGVTCNAICPGFIETDMTSELSESLQSQILERIPMRAFGQPEDIAAVVDFLCSESSRYITGQAIVVDGGLAM